jgi:hypothetical protein
LASPLQEQEETKETAMMHTQDILANLDTFIFTGRTGSSWEGPAPLPTSPRRAALAAFQRQPGSMAPAAAQRRTNEFFRISEQ